MGSPFSQDHRDSPKAEAQRLAPAPKALSSLPCFLQLGGENTDDGLRLVAQNLSQEAITLEKISFIDLPRDNQKTVLTLSLGLRAERYAQTNLPLVDLLTGDDCVARTMADGWKLVEISNYTLNPSVRNLIIENTNSFRIYQCVRAAKLTWRSDADAAST